MPPTATQPAPTFAALESAIGRSSYMRGRRFILGKKGLKELGTANVVVMVPDGGNLGSKQQNQLNLHECPLTFKCHLWATDLDELWALLGAFDNALWDYRVTNNVEVLAGELTVDDDADSTEGESLIVLFSIRFCTEKKPLPPQEGSDAVATGVVKTAKIVDSNGNVAPPILPHS